MWPIKGSLSPPPGNHGSATGLPKLSKSVNIDAQCSGGFGGGGPNSFDFMQFLGKFGKIVCCRPPPGELAPPWGNPGSAAAV